MNRQLRQPIRPFAPVLFRAIIDSLRAGLDDRQAHARFKSIDPADADRDLIIFRRLAKTGGTQ